MLVAGEVKGELARIVPARTCCRRAELAGLLSTDRTVGQVSTFDYGTARIAVQLAASLGLPISGPHPAVWSGRPAGDRSPRRHHLVVGLDRASIGDDHQQAPKSEPDEQDAPEAPAGHPSPHQDCRCSSDPCRC